MPNSLSIYCKGEQHIPFSEMQSLLEQGPHPPYPLALWQEEVLYFREHQPVIEPIPEDREQWHRIGARFGNVGPITVTRFQDEQVLQDVEEDCSNYNVPEHIARQLRQSCQEISLQFPWSWQNVRLHEEHTLPMTIVTHLATELAKRLHGLIADNFFMNHIEVHNEQLHLIFASFPEE